MKIILSLLFALLFFVQSYAQMSGFELYKKVMGELHHKEIEKLRVVEDILEAADTYMQEADKMQQNIDLLNVKFPYMDEKEKKKYEKKIKTLNEKARESTLKATILYTDADTLLYKTFRKNIESKRINDNMNLLILADLLQEEADFHYSTALALNALLKENEKCRDFIEIVNEIRHLEHLALQKISYTYGLYLGWSDVMKKYKAELNPKNESEFTFKADIITRDFLDIYADKSVFCVRVYTKRTPLSTEKLNDLKEKYSTIFVNFNKNWFTYTVGIFTNYADALQAAKQHEGAFVVAFKNIEQVSLIETIYEHYR